MGQFSPQTVSVYTAYVDYFRQESVRRSARRRKILGKMPRKCSLRKMERCAMLFQSITEPTASLRSLHRQMLLLCRSVKVDISEGSHSMRQVSCVLLGLAVFSAALLVAPETTQAGRLGRAVLATPHTCAPAPVCCEPCPEPVIFNVSVCNPSTGCMESIDLCIPACCVGVPCVTKRCTIIGSGLVRYDWCCGFTAIVRFNRCGDYRVIYRG